MKIDDNEDRNEEPLISPRRDIEKVGCISLCCIYDPSWITPHCCICFPVELGLRVLMWIQFFSFIIVCFQLINEVKYDGYFGIIATIISCEMILRFISCVLFVKFF